MSFPRPSGLRSKLQTKSPETDIKDWSQFNCLSRCFGYYVVLCGQSEYDFPQSCGLFISNKHGVFTESQLIAICSNHNILDKLSPIKDRLFHFWANNFYFHKIPMCFKVVSFLEALVVFAMSNIVRGYARIIWPAWFHLPVSTSISLHRLALASLKYSYQIMNKHKEY